MPVYVVYTRQVNPCIEVDAPDKDKAIAEAIKQWFETPCEIIRVEEIKKP